MIKGFRDQRTESLFNRKRVKGLAEAIQKACLRKLLIIEAAESLDDLRIPPGNRLEKLMGDRKGQYSIRVNEQWRICSVWDGSDAHSVELVDYH